MGKVMFMRKGEVHTVPNAPTPATEEETSESDE